MKVLLFGSVAAIYLALYWGCSEDVIGTSDTASEMNLQEGAIDTSHMVLEAEPLEGVINTGDKVLQKVDPLSFPLDNGILQPESKHQRYRRDEHLKWKTFYQWWFFAVKDLDDDHHFTFTYAMLDNSNSQNPDRGMINFSMTSTGEQTGFTKGEHYPLSQLKVENHFDYNLDADTTNDEIEYTIQVINDDTYRIRGKMLSSTEIPYADGKFKGEPLEPDIPIHWDLTIHRIYGWYGQRASEPLQILTGIIGWNTYSHSSEVEGYITVGDHTYEVVRGVDARAYCDQNWGRDLPKGYDFENPIDYPWGWYYVGLPNIDRSKELSIIAGTGRYNTLTTGIAEGSFADIRLDQNTHIEVAKSETHKLSTNRRGIARSSTNDGKLADFNVERDEWTDFTDALGSHPIPLRQKVTIQTEHYLVELDFKSKLEDYNRLRFMHENYIFSDFEALGVEVHVVIHYLWETKTYKDSDKLKLFPEVQKHSKELYNFTSHSGGLEYGYRLNQANTSRTLSVLRPHYR